MILGLWEFFIRSSTPKTQNYQRFNILFCFSHCNLISWKGEGSSQISLMKALITSCGLHPQNQTTSQRPHLSHWGWGSNIWILKGFKHFIWHYSCCLSLYLKQIQISLPARSNSFVPFLLLHASILVTQAKPKSWAQLTEAAADSTSLQDQHSKPELLHPGIWGIYMMSGGGWQCTGLQGSAVTARVYFLRKYLG